MDLTHGEIQRYARHLVLAEVGGGGQQRLKRARLLVVGAGGLGAPVLQYCAAAGVSTIGIVDDDIVSLSDLQRQVIHDTAAVGLPKVESARAGIARINPEVAVETHRVRCDSGNAAALVAAYDIVADCTDNFATRYLVADTCEALRKPLATAAVSQFDGSLTFLKPFAAGPDGTLNPTYRSLFPEPPTDGTMPTCAVAGVLGALTGIVGTLQAMELIKEIVGIGSSLVGRLLLVDARDMRFETIAYRRNPDTATPEVVPAPAG